MSEQNLPSGPQTAGEPSIESVESAVEPAAGSAVAPSGAAGPAAGTEPVTGQDAVPVPASVPAQLTPGQQPAPAPGFGPTPEAAPAEQGRVEGVAPVPGRSRRGIALVAAAALVAVAVGGGIGYAALHHGGGAAHAEHPATSTPWVAPTPTATKAFGARSGGSHYGSLRLLLLPMPDDYGPGPDVQTFGNDTVLDAAQATALLKSTRLLTDKPAAAERKATDDYVATLHIEGGGLRTYKKNDGRLVAEMLVVQLHNQRMARLEAKLFGRDSQALGVVRNGPKITGHPRAVCILPAQDPGEQLDVLFCQATEGDLLVTMRVEGTVPFDKTSAADLLRRQLDRIQDPGESV